MGSLGLNTESGGSFEPWVKYDARAGRWFRKPTEAEGKDRTIDITDNFAAVFDFSGIEVGYILFATGQGPQYAVQPVAQGLPPKPPGDYKQGFRLSIVLPDNLGGGVYELAATAKAVIGPIDEMYTVYSAAPEAAQGKLPVYRMAGTIIQETNSPKGTTRNYAPRLELVNWVPRPASLGAVKTQATSISQAPQTATLQPAATGSTQVAPPAQKPAPAAAELVFG